MKKGGLHMEIFLGFLGTKSNCKQPCLSVYLFSATTASQLLPSGQRTSRDKCLLDNSPGPGRQANYPSPADIVGTSFYQFYDVPVGNFLYFWCCYLNSI